MLKIGSGSARYAESIATRVVAAPRLTALDGLRGIAALVVVAFHYTVGYGTPLLVQTYFAATPLHLLWDGAAAVSLFFVLSGFVLSYGYLRTGNEQLLCLGCFYLSRILRLLMPYAIAFLLSALCVRYFFSYQITDPQGQVGFFFIEWIKAASMPMRSLLMNGMLHKPAIAYSVMPQAWTLSVELYLSLIFPLLIMLIRRAELLFVGILLLLPVYHYLPINHPYPLMTSGVVHFMLGMMLARHRENLANLSLVRSAWRRSLFLIIGVVCLSVRHVINIPMQLFNPFGVTVWDIAAFGAFIIVWMALVSVPFRRLLCLPWIQWLGRISYSLYLLHFLVLYLLVPKVLHVGNVLGVVGSAAWLFGLIAALLFSLVLAQCFYWAVEHPFTRLARLAAKARDKTSPIEMNPIRATS